MVNHFSTGSDFNDVRQRGPELLLVDNLDTGGPDLASRSRYLPFTIMCQPGIMPPEREKNVGFKILVSRADVIDIKEKNFHMHPGGALAFERPACIGEGERSQANRQKKPAKNSQTYIVT
jgi:hypothetical protein